MPPHEPPLTDEESAEILKKLLSGDPENDHQEADDHLCRLLRSLGYEKTVEVYHSFSKWYA